MPQNSEHPIEQKAFEFHFSGYVDADFLNKDKDIKSLVDLLNTKAESVEDEIKYILKSTISTPGIDIYVKIEFFEGSVELWGLVAIIVSSMNVLSAISGTVDFFDKTAKAIHFAIKRSVRRQILLNGAKISKGSFNVNVTQPNPISYSRIITNTQSSFMQSIQVWQREQSRLIHLIIQNQNVILDGFIKKESENNKLRLYSFGLLVILIITIYFLTK